MSRPHDDPPAGPRAGPRRSGLTERILRGLLSPGAAALFSAAAALAAVAAFDPSPKEQAALAVGALIGAGCIALWLCLLLLTGVLRAALLASQAITDEDRGPY